MISTAAVQLLHEYTGRGPTKAKTLINETWSRSCLRTRSQRASASWSTTAAPSGSSQLRHDYQLAMRDDLIAIVERQLERKVIAFMSQNHIDPDLAVEVFVLEPGAAA